MGRSAGEPSRSSQAARRCDQNSPRLRRRQTAITGETRATTATEVTGSITPFPAIPRNVSTPGGSQARMEDNVTTIDPAELLRHSAWIRGLAIGLVGDPSAAEDAVQETWVAAIRKSSRRIGPIRPWLAGILRKCVLQEWRENGRRDRRQRESARPEATPSTAEPGTRAPSRRGSAARTRSGRARGASIRAARAPAPRRRRRPAGARALVDAVDLDPPERMGLSGRLGVEGWSQSTITGYLGTNLNVSR
jgi:DNA-directed RNA polymerase specialized sigma24 family protein